MKAIIWGVLILGLLSWALVALWKKGVGNFWRLLSDTNERCGTCFGTSPDNKATVVGTSLYQGGVLAFDQVHRKIGYITQGGKSIEILGYDFVQSWRVTSIARTSGGGAQFGIVAVGSANTRHDKVILEITTNDINRPIVKLPMSSLQYAKESSTRLQIMINAKK